MEISGNYAYLAGADFGMNGRLRIVDISDPSNPAVVGSTYTEGISSGLAIRGNYAYMANYTGGLRIVDISNPTAPTEIGAFDTEGLAIELAIANNYAYVADWNTGLRIIDISDPYNPFEGGFYVTTGASIDIGVSGIYAFVADYFGGFYIIRNDLPVAIADNTNYTSTNFVLNQNYPNPFNPSTTIGFTLPKSSMIDLKIYNQLGQQVRTLIHSNRSAGDHLIEWDGRNDAGKLLSSGIYFCILQAGLFTETRKMMLLR